MNDQPDTSEHQVIFVDCWDRKVPNKGSSHATLSEAEECCRHIVIRDLEKNHDSHISWLQALRQHLWDGHRPCIEGGTLAGRVGFHEFARRWTGEQIFPQWPALLDRIATTAPEIPRGRFRWLHHGRAMRHGGHEVRLSLSREWEDVAMGVSLEPQRLDDALMMLFERHAWQVGRLGLSALATAAWPRLSRGARGSFLAGFSNSRGHAIPGALRATAKKAVNMAEMEWPAWIMARLPEAELDAASVLEIACEAMSRWSAKEALLQAVFEHGRGRLQEAVERMEPGAEVLWSSQSAHAAHVGRASSRVIDQVLEEAIIQECDVGVKLALDHGADPNAHLWWQAEHFNEHHTSLSFAMRLKKTKLVDLVVHSPAICSGPTQAVALWEAVRQRHDDWVDALVAKGVRFENNERPAWVEALTAEERAASFGPGLLFSAAELEIARQLAAALPCLPVDAVSWFYHGDGEGGTWHTLLDSLLQRDSLEWLQHLASLGMPLKLTHFDYAVMAHAGAMRCLAWLMDQWQMSREENKDLLALLEGICPPHSINLTCHVERNKSVPFRVELLRDALRHLISDARQCYRVYELMMIRRPGDLWKYLMVRLVSVPASVGGPNGCVQLEAFDKRFYWAWDDTTPESNTWLTYRQGPDFKKVINQWFSEIRQTQQELREGGNVLIRHEIVALDQHAHPLDHKPATPFEITRPGHQSFTLPCRSEAYYDKLRELVARPDVGIVSVRGDDDYQTLRIVLEEQRRRADTTGQRPHEAFTVHVLTDGLRFVSGWNVEVIEWQEGLGYGDLLIAAGARHSTITDPDGRAPHGYDLRPFERRLFLTHHAGPEAEGWNRKAGPGWTFYEDTRQDQHYAECIAQSRERNRRR
ncbi:MAG: hypothetical protein ACO1TE_22895 [Prosthecobacter sp.]